MNLVGLLIILLLPFGVVFYVGGSAGGGLAPIPPKAGCRDRQIGSRA